METRDDIPRDDVERFDAARDMILLDDRSHQEDDDVGGDEREVLGFRDDDEDEEDEEEDEQDGEGTDKEEDEEDAYEEETAPARKASQRRTARPAPRDAVHAEAEEDREEDEDELGWGANKRSYYSGNTEEDMESDSEIDEEKAHELETNEAIRLQRLSRSGLVDDEFGIGDIDAAEAHANEDEMSAAARQKRRKEIDQEDEGGSTNLLPDELVARLQVQAPVILALVNEYGQMLESMNNTHTIAVQTDGRDQQTSEIFHLYDQTQSTYVMLLAFVFQLAMSREYAGSPDRLLSHPIMDRLAQFKAALVEMQSLGLFSDTREDLIGPPTDEDLAYENLGDLEDNEVEDLIEDEKENQQLSAAAYSPEPAPAPVLDAQPKRKTKSKKKAQSETPLETVIEMDEAPLASVADVGPEAPSVPRGVKESVAEDEDAFGEPTQLRDHEYAEKMAHQRSVQFHANQMHMRDANARGPQAAHRLEGDSDIPYRDRQRSRETVAATNANKAAKKRAEFPPEDDFGEDGWEDTVDDQGNDDDDAQYYDLVQSNKRARRSTQKEEHDRVRDESRVWDDDTVAPGEHRSIDRTIEKNKGLTQNRPKNVRNPRVKRRQKFDRANKRLSSTRPVYKGGQSALHGGYSGEKSGISTHVVKSRKLG